MRRFTSLSVLAAALLFTPTLSAQPQPQAQSEPILHVLQQQADDWNRGDLDAFATGYKRSPDILFVGPANRRGYDDMLAGYRKGFSTPEKMGKLSFTQLEVQPLDEHFATVTGHFHLERTANGGGNTNGYFLLVMEKTGDGWKIVRDASTRLP